VAERAVPPPSPGDIPGPGASAGNGATGVSHASAGSRPPGEPSTSAANAIQGVPVVLLEGVTKDFGEALVTRVLKGIDFRLDRREFTALIGPSGSGKSTLLNLIGLLDRPTTGRIDLDGTDTHQLDEAGLTRLRGRSIGFVFQFHHLLPAFSALENVMLPGIARDGRANEPLRRRAVELLNRVGLSDRLKYKPAELSGGQQQRVAIARALSLKPRLILADEPTGNLDTASSDQVFELLREINREEQTAFLVVTHDTRMAARCDRIVELVDGRITGDRENQAQGRPDLAREVPDPRHLAHEADSHAGGATQTVVMREGSHRAAIHTPLRQRPAPVSRHPTWDSPCPGAPFNTTPFRDLPSILKSSGDSSRTCRRYVVLSSAGWDSSQAWSIQPPPSPRWIVK
jgi:lipoprotein-releasing system ATP-binding protein